MSSDTLAFVSGATGAMFWICFVCTIPLLSWLIALATEGRSLVKVLISFGVVLLILSVAGAMHFGTKSVLKERQAQGCNVEAAE